MKVHILQLLERCADVTPKDDEYSLFEELIDGCDVNEEYLPLISEDCFRYVEALFEFLVLDRRRWRKHFNRTGESLDIR